MANYLARGTGAQSLVEVPGQATSAGAADAGKIPQLDSTGRLDQSLMPVGVTPDVYTSTASGALSAGDWCYVKSDGTIARATAAAGTPVQADGFVLSASANGAAATLFFEGRNTALSSLTVGARYYLSDTTPGGATPTPVTGTGKIHQYLGKAITATTIAFEGDDAILLA
ncbi:hypothetical protein K8Z61_18570 [Nocardioides sp. TRM66260-LWL]|uniref:hypothetical protein n=1 Tax=Nocardioides sp. TRM66260-LWL TaxID=2874478 RepID=UPI001CC58251|nr:hypothetical protein [Nocardioides sp. TRM66260-LWL]MBZ5736500.1 hypothetical protein [Nocardioides sp. TRM66260-LWL]